MLKRKKDGSFHSIASESDARLARERIDAATAEIVDLAKRAGIPALLEERGQLQTALDAYVLDRGAFESDTWKATRVQGHTRTWDMRKLQSLLPTPVYKLIIKHTVDQYKLDELVKEGKINLDLIEGALTERPNKPYLKWTPKGKDMEAAGKAEADKLAEMLS